MKYTMEGLFDLLNRQPELDKRIHNKDLWGSINFSGLEIKLKQLYKIRDYIKPHRLSEVPECISAMTGGEIEHTMTQILKIDEFDLKKGGTETTAQDIVRAFNGPADKLIGAWMPWSISCMQEDLGLGAAAKDAKNELLKVEKIKTECVEIREEAQDVIKSVKVMASEQGLSQYAESYKARLEDHRKLNKLWLRAGGSCAGAVIGLIFYTWGWDLPVIWTTSTVVSVAAKATMSVILLGLSRLCFSKSNKLDESIEKNEDKVDMLATYPTLTKSAKGTKVEDEVLRVATTAIFSSPKTMNVADSSSVVSVGIPYKEVLDKATE